MEQEGKHRRVHRSDGYALRHGGGSCGAGELVSWRKKEPTVNRQLGGGAICT